MKHLPGCPWVLNAASGCACAETAYLADATDDELAAWDARNKVKTTSALLDVSAVHWRGRV